MRARSLCAPLSTRKAIRPLHRRDTFGNYSHVAGLARDMLQVWSRRACETCGRLSRVVVRMQFRKTAKTIDASDVCCEQTL